MAYEPTVWKSGDVVTSAKLNNIEQGIANATPMVLLFSDETGACDHTWLEIRDALSANRMVVSPYVEGQGHVELTLIVAAVASNNKFAIYEVGGLSAQTPIAAADSPDGYPVFGE